MLLTHACEPARLDETGRLVRLADQDRTRWRRELIHEGHELVRACLRRNEPGPYQVQAAIAAVHADARCASDTDWGQMVSLYDHLLALQPSRVVALNRAIAVLEHRGREGGTRRPRPGRAAPQPPLPCGAGRSPPTMRACR